MSLACAPKKRDIPKAGKIVWWYRTVFHRAFRKDVPPVLCNSFQKSGTHLLVNVVASLPQFRQYGRKAYWHYLSRGRVDSKKISSIPQVIERLSRGLPGEILRGHISAHPELQDFFARGRIKHLFIYRDLRDVVVSFLHGMKRRKAVDTWPARYFYALVSDEERLDFLIRGLPKGIHLEGFPQRIKFPNIAERFCENMPWLQDPNCLAVRFEDLVSPETCDETHESIARYLFPELGEEKLHDLKRNMQEGHDPQKSHTFRKGVSGEWRKYFSDRQVALFKEVAGQMLIDLGYEDDFDW